jgi:hypothetical protein
MNGRAAHDIDAPDLIFARAREHTNASGRRYELSSIVGPMLPGSIAWEAAAEVESEPLVERDVG